MDPLQLPLPKMMGGSFWNFESFQLHSFYLHFSVFFLVVTIELFTSLTIILTWKKTTYDQIETTRALADERRARHPLRCTTNATTGRMIETSAIASNDDPQAHGTTNIARGMVKLEMPGVLLVEIGHELKLTFLGRKTLLDRREGTVGRIPIVSIVKATMHTRGTATEMPGPGLIEIGNSPTMTLATAMEDMLDKVPRHMGAPPIVAGTVATESVMTRETAVGTAQEIIRAVVHPMMATTTTEDIGRGRAGHITP